MAASTTTAQTARPADTTGDALLSRAGRLMGYFLVGKRCPVCRQRLTFDGDKKTGCTYDHVVPYAKGGAVVGNLIPMCASCNSSKQDTDLEEWLPGRLVDTEVASTTRGAKRMVKAELKKIEDIRAELTAALIDADIWTA